MKAPVPFIFNISLIGLFWREPLIDSGLQFIGRQHAVAVGVPGFEPVGEGGGEFLVG